MRQKQLFFFLKQRRQFQLELGPEKDCSKQDGFQLKILWRSLHFEGAISWWWVEGNIRLRLSHSATKDILAIYFTF